MPAEKQGISAANTCAPTLHSNAISLIYNRLLRTQGFTERMTGEYSQIYHSKHIMTSCIWPFQRYDQKLWTEMSAKHKLALHNIPKELNPAKRKRILEQRLSAV
jgi:hypothetical protein